jgi:hypothetical protein
MVGGQRHASAALPPGKDPVPIVEEYGRASGPVWTDAETSHLPTGNRSPDRPTRSKSLPGVQKVICSKFDTERPTNKRRHGRKFSRPRAMALGIFAPLTLHDFVIKGRTSGTDKTMKVTSCC